MSSKVKVIAALAGGAATLAAWPVVAIYKQCSRDAQGYNKYGYDRAGFDRSGFNRKGFNKDGYDRQGYNISGYDREGFKRDGFNKDGFDREGFNRKGYDKNALDRNGLDIDGFDSDGYNVYGVNRAGFTRKTAFDLLNQQKEKCEEAFRECQSGRYDEMLNKCRKIMECILIYICQVEKTYCICKHQPPGLDEMIQVCHCSGTFSDSFAFKLTEAKKYCNRGSHYQMVDEEFNNVWFTYKTTEELLDYWEKKYIFS